MRGSLVPCLQTTDASQPQDQQKHKNEVYEIRSSIERNDHRCRRAKNQKLEGGQFDTDIQVDA